MPSASQGTLSTAPSRKKTRNVPWSQPVEAAGGERGRGQGEQGQGEGPGALVRRLRAGVAHAGGLREHGRDGGGEEGEAGDHGGCEGTSAAVRSENPVTLGESARTL